LKFRLAQSRPQALSLPRLRAPEVDAALAGVLVDGRELLGRECEIA
jgi:hypothetical protein